ncbi:mitogen-activated protein kinase kinase 3-like [Malus sylvestris]|uniref:mitogen-activated protein kinase kinase 3-like n=1 Tax=Malus sylvestris TaxID=3752 RepID=UPI0021AC4BBE|nr:mitogen-activated protein kinase kinase 3-like [Malus sylvestris]
MRVFGAIGSGASSVVRRAIHIPTYRILALKKINIFEKEFATFVGTVTYMSPERIRNENYSYPAHIWSLGLALFECGTGEFSYTANEGPVNLMLQILSHPFITKYEDSQVDLGAFV